MRTQNEENAHSPGPWRASKGTGYVAIMAGPTIDKQLAMTMTCNAEGMANARLIAAAPELLEELETAVLRIAMANAEGVPILSAWLPHARAAIAKARGEA